MIWCLGNVRNTCGGIVLRNRSLLVLGCSCCLAGCFRALGLCGLCSGYGGIPPLILC